MSALLPTLLAKQVRDDQWRESDEGRTFVHARYGHARVPFLPQAECCHPASALHLTSCLAPSSIHRYAATKWRLISKGPYRCSPLNDFSVQWHSCYGTECIVHNQRVPHMERYLPRGISHVPLPDTRSSNRFSDRSCMCTHTLLALHPIRDTILTCISNCTAFSFNRFFRTPVTSLVKVLVSALGSAAFLASFVGLYQSIVCLQRKIFVK